MQAAEQRVHQLPGGGHVAYRLTQPAQHASKASVVFLHGLCSSMQGNKAAALEQHARQRGHGFLCFDQRGHGSSSGRFEETHMGDWYDDCVTALQLAPGTQHVLVGSSFGGWLALWLALLHPQRVAGLLLVAPAVDYTSRFWASLTPQQQQQAVAEGAVALPSSYVEGGSIRLRHAFFKEAERFLLLDKLQEQRLTCPVHIMHGVQDDAVSVEVSQRLFQSLPADDMVLALIKDGDHRLSRPQDLRLLLSSLDGLLARVAERAIL